MMVFRSLARSCYLTDYYRNTSITMLQVNFFWYIISFFCNINSIFYGFKTLLRKKGHRLHQTVKDPCTWSPGLKKQANYGEASLVFPNMPERSRLTPSTCAPPTDRRELRKVTGREGPSRCTEHPSHSSWVPVDIDCSLYPVASSLPDRNYGVGPD